MKNLYLSLYQSKNPMETARQIAAPICMKKINEYILECNECDLGFGKKICIGNPLANILIINEPAKDNTIIYELFVNALSESIIDTNDIFVINSVSCVCAKDPIPKMKNNCKYFVDYAIDFIKPKVIISMGATSLNQFCPNTTLDEENINKDYQFNGIPTYVTYSIDYYLKIRNKCSDDYSKCIYQHIIDTFNKTQKHINLIKR